MGYYLDRRRAAFAAHKNDAKRRGIEFHFTFDEWWAIWEASGRWAERGTRRGQYCMSRPNDKGPYIAENVRICVIGDNHAERNKIYRVSGEKHHNYGKDLSLLLLDPIAREKHKLASAVTASRRQRDARGCFLPGAIS